MNTNYYDDDELTPEEEAEFMGMNKPRPPSAPIAAPTQTPYNMDPMLRQQLINELMSRRTMSPGPSSRGIATGANIESSALQGIAGGMAQLGTVHGKTPDARPYQAASQGMSKALYNNVSGNESQFDPRILAYLAKGQQKQQQGKLLPQRDSRGFYLEQDQTGEIKPSQFKGYDQPKDPKAPRPEGADLPIDKKKEVESLASANAGYKASKAELDAGIKEYSLALDNLKKEDSKANRDQAVRVGQSLLKILNSARGSDAVGAEEVQRLGNALSFQFANVNNPGKFWGYDFPGFFSQINSASEKINNTINTIQKQIDQNMGRSVQMQMSVEDKQAADWAKANSNDPRSQAILDRIAKKYGGGK